MKEQADKDSQDATEYRPEYLESPVDGALSHLEGSTELSKQVANELGIDEQQAERAIEIVRQSYSGPIPFAAELDRYNHVSPGLGTDIARDYLKGREHDRVCEQDALSLAHKDSDRKDNWLRYARRGQSFGFISQAVFVLAALAAMGLGHLYLAGLFIGPPALGVVSQFIKGIRDDNEPPPSKDGKP